MEIEKIKKLHVETERLLIRRFEENDIKSAFENWASDEEVSKMLDWDAYTEISDLEETVFGWMEEKDHVNYQFAVILKETQEVIGGFSVKPSNSKHSVCEIGYSYRI